MSDRCQIDNEACAETDRDFERVWRAQYSNFYRKARRLAQGNHDLAETLISKTTIKILEHTRGSSQPIRNIEAFFYVSLRNASHDHWRKHRRDAEGLSSLKHQQLNRSAPDETLRAVMARQELSKVMALLNRIPDTGAALIRMRILNGRSYPEIARMLDISEALARKRMQMARKLLRDLIEAENLHESRHNFDAASSSTVNRTSASGGSYGQ